MSPTRREVKDHNAYATRNRILSRIRLLGGTIYRKSAVEGWQGRDWWNARRRTD